jgi:hypothetical protein
MEQSQFNPNPNQFQSGKVTRISINPSDTTAVVCPCGSDIFAEGLWLRRVSQLLGGPPEPVRLPVTYCVKCLKVVPDFLPPALRPVIEC